MKKHFETIQNNIEAAAAHLVAIHDEMERLKRAGMYPSVPTESWQTRNGGDTRYLYHLFRTGRDGEYQGPDGKRKLYVGCQPERIAQARALSANRRRYDELAQAHRRLKWWLDDKRSQLANLARISAHWPKVELGSNADVAGGLRDPKPERELERKE